MAPSPSGCAQLSTESLVLHVLFAGCALSVGFAIFVTLSMKQDIDAFRWNATEDLAEFVNYSNSAWEEIMAATAFAQQSTDERRSKRQDDRLLHFRKVYGAPAVSPYYFSPPTPFRDEFVVGSSTSSCPCARAAHTCDAGPMGPPGAPGEPGFDGLPGRHGDDGIPGMRIHFQSDEQGCISCPPGPPGVPGQDGVPGPLGPSGFPGSPGVRGKDGQPGRRGPAGDRGQPGHDGPHGPVGRRGSNGIRQISPPGHKGLPGPRGPHGAEGLRGMPGSRGYPGGPGPIGSTGKPGAAGVPGQNGQPGLSGLPGVDGVYCPCPKRTDDIIEQSEEYLGPVEKATMKTPGSLDQHSGEVVQLSSQVMVSAANRMNEEYRRRFRNLVRRWRQRKRLVLLRSARSKQL